MTRETCAMCSRSCTTQEGAQRTRRSREDLSGEFEVEVHGAVFTAGGKSLRNTSGEAAR